MAKSSKRSVKDLKVKKQSKVKGGYLKVEMSPRVSKEKHRSVNGGSLIKLSMGR